MQETFQLFDSRGDNKIHISQIGDALRALGQNPTESDVKKFTHQHKPGVVSLFCWCEREKRMSYWPFRYLRFPTDERISFDVFLPIYQAISKGRSSDTADDFIEGLRHFDKDGNGFISSAELRHLLTTLGTFRYVIFLISTLLSLNLMTHLWTE
jgi:myosin light chain 6